MRYSYLRLALWAPLLAAVPPAAAGGFSVTTHGEVRDCSDIEVTARGRQVATAADTIRVPAPAAGRRLSVETSRQGGVYVVGGGAGGYEVRLCKIAAADDSRTAAARLAEIDAEIRDGRLAVRGPAGDDWLAYLLITAPAGAAMEVSVLNGPLSVHGVDGDFRLRATNGPISLQDTAGTFDVVVRNGPVSVADGGGRMTIDAQNGPISVELSGEEWRGEGLEARSLNGPLSLSIERSFQSAVLVESSGHGPWSCSNCGEGSRSWDDGGRRFEYGAGPPRVRLSTENGPVAVEVH
jgi:hypothetical protein